MANPVTDPALIAQLEAQAQSQSGVVTDPKLIAELEGANAAPAPSWQDQTLNGLKHGLGLTGRMVTSAVTALPYVAMDAGVGGRNVIGDAYNKLAGNPATPDYDLPSADLHQWQDQTFGKPQNTAEKVEDFAAPMAMGAVATAGPKALAAVLGGATPELGTTMGGTAGPLSSVPSTLATQKAGQAQLMAALIKRSQNAGYVIPPSSANPSAINKLTETVGGKIATQQKASIRNQGVTNRLAAEANGLSPSAPLTKGALASVRAEAAKGYEAVRSAGDIPTDDDYLNTIAGVQERFEGKSGSFPGSKVSPLVDATDTLAVDHFDASHAVDKIGELRDLKSAAFRAGNNQEGYAYGQLSKALEDQMDRVLQVKAEKGEVSPDLVAGFRSSRQRIAVAHSTEEALNDATGNVSTQTLARMLKNGQPLSGGLKTAGEFGRSFDKAAQSPEKIGSPVSHTNSWATLALGGVAEHMTDSPYALAAGLAWPYIRGAGKAYALGPAQKGLADSITGSSRPMSARAAALAQALAQVNP